MCAGRGVNYSRERVPFLTRSFLKLSPDQEVSAKKVFGGGGRHWRQHEAPWLPALLDRCILVTLRR